MIGAKLAASEIIAVLQCILWSILLSFNHIYIQNVLLVLFLAAIIAAFVAGLAVQVGFKDAGKHSVEFTEGWGQLVNLCVFFLFGLISGVRPTYQKEYRNTGDEKYIPHGRDSISRLIISEIQPDSHDCPTF